jgi:hypothetical protein
VNERERVREIRDGGRGGERDIDAHALTHTHIYKRTHTHTYSISLSLSHTHTHTHTHTLNHTHTHYQRIGTSTGGYERDKPYLDDLLVFVWLSLKSTEPHKLLLLFLLFLPRGFQLHFVGRWRWRCGTGGLESVLDWCGWWCEGWGWGWARGQVQR